MTKFVRRGLGTTAAVVGMTALGTVFSGTAFANSAPDFDQPAHGSGPSESAPVDAMPGLPTEAVDGADLHSFQMPTARPSSRDDDEERSSTSGRSSRSSSRDDDGDERGASGGRSSSATAKKDGRDSKADETTSDDEDGDRTKHDDEKSDPTSGLFSGLL